MVEFERRVHIFYRARSWRNSNPEPPIHSLDTLKLPRLILTLFDVPPDALDKHIWNVHVKIIEIDQDRFRREVKVLHQGIAVDESLSRPWRL